MFRWGAKTQGSTPFVCSGCKKPRKSAPGRTLLLAWGRQSRGEPRWGARGPPESPLDREAACRGVRTSRGGPQRPPRPAASVRSRQVRWPFGSKAGPYRVPSGCYRRQCKHPCKGRKAPAARHRATVRICDAAHYRILVLLIIYKPITLLLCIAFRFPSLRVGTRTRGSGGGGGNRFVDG